MFSSISIDIPDFTTFDIGSEFEPMQADFTFESPLLFMDPPCCDALVVAPKSPSLSTSGSLNDNEVDYNDEVDKILKSIPTKELKRQRVHKSVDQKAILEQAINVARSWPKLKAEVP